MVRVSSPLIKVEIEPLEHTFQKFKNSIHKFKIPKWLILDTVNMHSENEMIYKWKFWETLNKSWLSGRVGEGAYPDGGSWKGTKIS